MTQNDKNSNNHVKVIINSSTTQVKYYLAFRIGGFGRIYLFKYIDEQLVSN